MIALPARWPAPLQDLAALGSGALLSAAFAPLGWWPLAILCPALLFLLWDGATPRRAAWLGFLFNAGTFGVGTYCLYVSIHIFGQAPVWLALLLMLGLVAIMASYQALLGWSVVRWAPRAGPVRWLAVIPAAWLLIEWLRGWFLSGFGWLSLGYSQTDTWLAALAPVGGLYLLSWLLLLAAGALVTLLHAAAKPVAGPRAQEARARRLVAASAVALVVVTWLGAFGLQRVEWTRPAGPAVGVAVLQGAIPQDLKWIETNRDTTLDLYRDLTRQALGTPLIVWPEAATPDLANNLVEYLTQLRDEAQAANSALVMGILRAERRADGSGELDYFNAILALDREVGWYDKHHLVPFAEFFPVPQFVRRWLRLMSLPYSDFQRGSRVQPPLSAAGLELSASICYEDAYGSTQLPVLREATALVNVTNDAWFGRSTARYQHLQISRMRAIESQRFLIRAANDGVSALIGPRGEVLARAPEFEKAVLRGSVTPRTGLPPYARVGNWPVIIGALLVLIAGLYSGIVGTWRSSPD